MTKNQELEILEQIEDLIEQAGGTRSYIGMTFEGCIELAKYNIENDFGISYKSKTESAEKSIEELKIKIVAQEANAKADKETIERLSRRKEQLEKELEMAQKNAHTAIEWNADSQKQIEEKDCKIAEQEQQILILKAKLYDFLAK